MEKVYILYKTTNKINGKIYVGIHSTCDLNDGYLGSGPLILNAVKKYGKENFNREILYKCEDYKELQEIEAQLVNEEFIKRKDTYNIVLGGGLPPRSEEYEIKRIKAVSESTKNRVWMNKNGKHKRVIKNELELWIEDGWLEGRIVGWNTERNKKHPQKRDKNTGQFIKKGNLIK